MFLDFQRQSTIYFHIVHEIPPYFTVVVCLNVPGKRHSTLILILYLI